MARPNTREEIVQAGLKCLVEKGFNAVGVQDITDAAGVPKGSFYNHFESKEALGLEIVERYGASQTRREILTDPTVPPLQRLRRHFDRITALYADSHFTRNCILGGFSAELANQSETIREGCEQAPNRDPLIVSAIRLTLLMDLKSDGVPTGADRDPTAIRISD